MQASRNQYGSGTHNRANNSWLGTCLWFTWQNSDTISFLSPSPRDILNRSTPASYELCLAVFGKKMHFSIKEYACDKKGTECIGRVITPLLKYFETKF